jgi:hypothetical protein
VLKHKNGSPIPIRYCSYVFKDGCHAAAWSPIKDWREQYLAALLELDPAKFKQRIEVALAAVRHQMGEFERNTSASAHERQALRDALAALQALQRSN